MSSATPSARAPGGKFWFIGLAPGVTRSNMWTYVLAAYGTIGLLTFVAIGTPYVLNANLGIAAAVQGQITGDLQLLNEVVMILAFAPLGILADRIGRREVYAFGLLAMGVGYILYPLATSVGELGAFRVIYAVGIAAATGMLGTVVADYPDNHSRGKLVAFGGVLNGIGVVTVTLGIGRLLPNWLVSHGYDTVAAGRITHWIVAGLCILLAVIVAIGLKPGTPVQAGERLPWRDLAKSGLREARNPRIALAYACAFIARSDLVILGTFTVLWGQTAAMNDGLDAAQASGVGSRLFGTASLAALLWLPILGFILDRINRVSGVIFCMGFAAVAFLSMLFVRDAADPSQMGWFVLLGMGQISAFLGATVLISTEAPMAARGAVIGMFNVFGAVGILISTGIGGRLFDSVAPAAPFAMIGVLAALVTVFATYVRLTAPGEVGGREIVKEMIH
ncbi:MAG: MFS transporter [Gammaproteobacteria bacterium]|nr:MFS transporter [Gammaproteobacteria bacterium]